MKCTTYLTLSTLIIGTASSSHTIRGSEEESVAPSRVFEEHSHHVESLSSSTHQEAEHENTKRALQNSNNNCNSDEQLLTVTLSPDQYSNNDNEFTISVRRNGKWQFLADKRGGYNEGFTICLSSGFHRFEAIDHYSDGILDGGQYQVSLGGNEIFQTPGGEWSRVVHKFDVVESEYGNDKTTDDEDEEEQPELQLMMGGDWTQIPTSVIPFSPPANKPPTPKPTKKPTPKPTPSNVVASALDSTTAPPPPPTPTPKPTTKQSEPVGTVSTGKMTDREKQWLEEHNLRREKYHKQKGKPYVPLKWSAYLKDSAQKWAEECARTGVFDHAWHLDIGENMARHTTNGDGYRHPSNILTRWTEDEMDDDYPDNGHMTQVLWRATHYVGCGEAKKGNKYYQVCQYSKPGNCGVNKSNFWTSVLADDSGCSGMPLLY